MTNDIHSIYHPRIFQRYANLIDTKINFDVNIDLNSGVMLKGTEQRTSCKVGLIIDTGMTVPRESFYPIFGFFPDLNILVYDKRGHADSGGVVDTIECIKDNYALTQKWKLERDLDTIVGIGHSYGGLVMACAAINPTTAYSAIIVLGAPIQLKKVVSRLPIHFTRITSYFYNLSRLTHKYAWDEIARHHRTFMPWMFGKQPSIMALRVGYAAQFNSAIMQMPNLMDILPQISKKAFFYYGGNDKRLGITGTFNQEYRNVNDLCHDLRISMKLLPGLSHRFNRQPENEYAFSYNNTIVLKEIRRVIDHCR